MLITEIMNLRATRLVDAGLKPIHARFYASLSVWASVFGVYATIAIFLTLVFAHYGWLLTVVLLLLVGSEAQLYRQHLESQVMDKILLEQARLQADAVRNLSQAVDSTNKSVAALRQGLNIIKDVIFPTKKKEQLH